MKEINIFFDLDGVIVDLKSTVANKLEILLHNNEHRKALLNRSKKFSLKYYFWILNQLRNISDLEKLPSTAGYIIDYILSFLTLNDYKIFSEVIVFDEVVDFVSNFKGLLNNFLADNVKLNILSAYLKPNTEYFDESERKEIVQKCIKEKEEFINNQLNFIDNYFLVGRKDKATFAVKYSPAILVDDYEKNVKEFISSGGYSILFNSARHNVLDLKNKLLTILNNLLEEIDEEKINMDKADSELFKSNI